MTRAGSQAELAINAGFAFQRGPEALAELDADVATCAARAMQFEQEGNKATTDVASLVKLEALNRDERARLRTQHRDDNAAALEAWRTGREDDFPKHAARFTAQLSEIAWLSERDLYSVNVLRPKLRLLSMRKDAAFAIAAADTLFAQAAVAAYHRHAALQTAVEVDGVAQLPSEGGRANSLWLQANSLLGRGAEISAAADALEAQIVLRETTI